MRVAIALVILCPPLAAFPIPKGAQAPSVADTTWEGTNRWSKGQVESLKLTFNKDGTLIYESGGMSSAHYRATWKQDGDTVTWTVNVHATFKATISGDKLEGSGSNNDANNATVAFTRREAK